MPARIVEWQLPYTWGTGIEIDTNKVISLLLREENNLIMVNSDNEVYTDLQLQSGLTPSSDFPVWVTTGKVLQSDWWEKSGLILNWKTTSGDYARWIYATDWKIYFDNGTGTWNQVYYSSEVDNLLLSLRQYVDSELAKKQNWVTSSTAPANPVQWDLWYDTNYDILKVFNWSQWVVTWWWGDTWDVVWPNSSVDGNVALFDGNTWKLIKDWWALPSVINNLTSTSTTDSLSANQWKVLNDKITTLQARGRFLSNWNATTWLPVSFPEDTPYTYKTWDYFDVTVVWTTNYKPNWSSYTWTASTTVETDALAVWDTYIYDGSVWLLQLNHNITTTFATISWQPSDNTNLASALNNKQDKLVSWTNIKTVNSTSLLGRWNVAVQPTLVSWTNIKTVNSTSLLWSGNVAVQPTLVSGTNIKTVNSTSLLGSGNIAVQATISDLTTIRTNATNWATVVSGDSGVIYTIKVSNSDPASWTASNIITLVP